MEPLVAFRTAVVNQSSSVHGLLRSCCCGTERATDSQTAHVESLWDLVHSQSASKSPILLKCPFFSYARVCLVLSVSLTDFDLD